MSILSKLNVSKPSRRSETIPLTTAEAQAVASRWIKAKRELQSAEAEVELALSQLHPMARASWFAGNRGRTTPVSGVEVVTPDGACLVSFSSVWSAKGGTDRLPSDLVRERFSLKIDGDSLPSSIAGQFVDDLLALAAKHGVPEAVKATGGLAPVPTFNEVRHTRLSPEENEAIEAAGLGTRISVRVR